PPPRPGSLAPNLGDHGPSDSALAASSDWRLRQPAADRHAARCASRDLCSGARHSAPCALGGMDAIQVLKKDHKEVKALLKEFEGLSGRAGQKKQSVVTQLCTALTVHAQVEEEVVYPAFKELRSQDIKDLVREAAEEHQVAKTLIGELQTLSP